MRLGLLIAIVVFVIVAATVYATSSRIHAGAITLHVPGLRQGDTLCATLWGWAPNGSIVKLAAGCSRGDRLTLPFQGLQGYLRDWYTNLESNRNNPDWVKPGVIAAIAVTRPGQGIYGYIKATPVDIAKTLLYRRLAIGLTPNEANRMMSKPLVAWRVLMSSASVWPPRTITSSTGATWILENVYYSKEKAPIPLSIVRLTGDLVHFKEDQAELEEYISLNYEHRLVFEAVAGISGGPFTFRPSRWEVAGTILELTPPTAHTYVALSITAMYSDYAETLYTGSDLYSEITHNKIINTKIKPMGPNKDVLLSVGFLGDTAIAEYCLRIPIVPGCAKTAFVAMTRPKLFLDLMYYWYEVDNNPEDGKGVSEKIFHEIMKNGNWTTGWNETIYGGFSKFINTIDNDYYTAPELSLSLPVGAILEAVLGSQDANLPILPAFAATMGTEHGYQGITVLHLALWASHDEDVIYYVRGLHPYQPVYYGDRFYKLGAAYYDVDVVKPVSHPPPPPGGGYITEKGHSDT